MIRRAVDALAVALFDLAARALQLAGQPLERS